MHRCENRRTLPGFDICAFHPLKAVRDVADKVFAICVAEDSLPEHPWLLKVHWRNTVLVRQPRAAGPLTFSDLAEISLSSTKEYLVVAVVKRLGLVPQRDDAALVMGASALVVYSHVSVPLEVRHWGNRPVHGELPVVHAKSVSI